MLNRYKSNRGVVSAAHTMSQIACALTVVLVWAACSSATGVEADGSFSNVVGAFCAAETSAVTRSGGNAEVKLKRNVSVVVEVSDAAGFLREQTRRSCLPITCLFLNGASQTDAQLIARCEDRGGT